MGEWEEVGEERVVVVDKVGEWEEVGEERVVVVDKAEEERGVGEEWRGYWSAEKVLEDRGWLLMVLDRG